MPTSLFSRSHCFHLLPLSCALRLILYPAATSLMLSTSLHAPRLHFSTLCHVSKPDNLISFCSHPISLVQCFLRPGLGSGPAATAPRSQEVVILLSNLAFPSLKSLTRVPSPSQLLSALLLGGLFLGPQHVGSSCHGGGPSCPWVP